MLSIVTEDKMMPCCLVYKPLHLALETLIHSHTEIVLIS